MITWEVSITPINVALRLVNISATGTDSEDVDNPITVSISRTKFATQPEQAAALNRLYSRYIAARDKNTAVKEWLANKEQEAKAYLEAK